MNHHLSIDPRSNVLCSHLTDLYFYLAKFHWKLREFIFSSSEQIIIFFYRKKRFSEEDKSIRRITNVRLLKPFRGLQAPGEQPPGWNSTPFQQARRYIWLSTTETEPRFRKILLRNPRRFRGLRMSCTGSPLCPPPFNPKGACSLVPRWFSVIAPHSFQLFELARLSTSFIVQYSSLEIFSISRAKLFNDFFVQRLVIAWISKLRVEKWRR